MTSGSSKRGKKTLVSNVFGSGILEDFFNIVGLPDAHLVYVWFITAGNKRICKKQPTGGGRKENKRAIVTR
jgi:hypothetical protein